MIASLALASLLAATPAAKMVVGGVERSYQLFVPEGAAPKAPLVVVLHGRLGTAAQVRRHSGFDEQAKARGALVLYPQGLDRRWNDLRRETIEPKLRGPAHDDVGFILAVIDKLIAEGRVDPTRVFVVGHSNGGFLALALACTHADRFAGVGAVAATVPRTPCQPSRSIPTMFFHGTADTMVPFLGGGVGPNGARGWVRSNAESAQLFAELAGCQPAVRRAPVDAVQDDGTRVIVEERAGCKAPVVNVVIEGGGHGWPGRQPPLPDNTREIDATAWLVAFFLDGKAP